MIKEEIIKVFDTLGPEIKGEHIYDQIGLWPSIKDYCAGFKVNQIDDHCYRLIKDMSKLKES